MRSVRGRSSSAAQARRRTRHILRRFAGLKLRTFAANAQMHTG
jgi:hypothetical protein